MIAAVALLLATNLGLTLVGCRGPQSRMNSVQRAAWAQRQAAARSERDRAEQQLWLTDERTRQVQLQLALAGDRLAATRARERQQARELTADLARLEALEQDSVAAAKRRQEIEAELSEVRALEQALAAREVTVSELKAALDAIEARLAAARAGLAERQQVVEGLLGEVAAEHAAVAESEAALRAALDAVRKSVAAPSEPPPTEGEAGGAGEKATGKGDG